MAENENLPNPSQFSRFKEHLDTSDNSRIIFSGKFGIGKTTFLKDFFEKERKDDYVIHLSPVYYSMSSNEDIVDLLKYDIIYELLLKNIKLEDSWLDKKDANVPFLTNKLPEVALTIIENISHTGKPIVKILKELVKISSEYEEYKNKFLNLEKEALEEFDKLIREKKGTYLHDDFYTYFIKTNLALIKGEDDKKKNVLIIDDLDRVDPEHIFRLFNVFAAHLHAPNEEDNKFGFDKVIFSCDIDNIQSVYHHKYGEKADFSGYIDKFYSSEVFRLNNREIIEFWISNMLPLDNNLFSVFDEDFLCDTLNEMLNCGVINFRNIKSVQKEDILRKIKLISTINNANGIYGSTYFPKVAPVLSSIIGDTELLIQKLNECKLVMSKKSDKKFTKGNVERYCAEYLIPIAEHSNHNFSRGNAKYFLNKVIPNSEKYFQYNIVTMGMKLIASLDYNLDREDENKISPNENIFNDIFWSLLIDAIKELRDKGYLE